MSVERIRTIVVLPAPFGPSRAKIVPSATARSTPSSTTVSPNDFRTLGRDDRGLTQVDHRCLR